MKKQILVNLLLVCSMTVNSQTWTGSSDVNNNLWRNGNVGIGTTSPSGAKLVVGRNSGQNNIMGVDHLLLGSASNAYYVEIQPYHTGNVYLATGGGNVGIGATSATFKLDVVGDINFTGNLFKNGTSFVSSSGGNIGIGTTTPSGAKLVVGRNSGESNIMGVDHLLLGSASNAHYVEIQPYHNGNVYLATGGGNVGIGTTSAAYKLDVCGTIRAKEIKVDLLGGCDFVFESNYKLMDLKDLETFVKTNQHLPEIASEKEMVENGVNMKELQMKLLMKIEELTLYTIEQQKQIEELKKQDEKIRTLEKKIEKLIATSK